MEGDVAGDFHEVVDLKDGRIAIVIGDAPGFGAAAAEHAGQLRSQARIELARGASPVEVLTRVDRALAAEDLERVATAVCAVIDPVERTVVVANAGHPPLLIVGHDDARWVPAPPDPPIGVRSERSESTYALAPDSTVFFYTDGLIERRGVALNDSLDLLYDSALTVTGSAAWASGLARIVIGHLGTPTDDATILSVRVSAAPTPGAVPFVGLDVRHVALRLFVDPTDHRSAHMEAVVAELAARLRGQVEIDVEVLDPASGHGGSDAVMATPTLVRLSPPPQLRIIGTVRSPDELARALHIPLAEGSLDS